MTNNPFLKGIYVKIFLESMKFPFLWINVNIFQNNLRVSLFLKWADVKFFLKLMKSSF